MRNHETMLKIGKLLDACKGCPFNIASNDYRIICKPCKNYQMIRQLGKKVDGDECKQYHNRLEMTVSEYKSMKEKGMTDLNIAIEKNVCPETVTQFKKNHGLRLQQKTGTFDLSVDAYKAMKSWGMKDKEICQQLGISHSCLTRWKKNHGLTDKTIIRTGKGRQISGPFVTRGHEVDGMLLQSAIKNHLDKRIICQRVIQGWSIEDACQTPILNRGHNLQEWKGENDNGDHHSGTVSTATTSAEKAE